MKIVVLLRYPRAEKSVWKKEIVERLVSKGDDVSLVFGASSYRHHLKAALKTFGPGFLTKREEVTADPQPLLAGHFKSIGLPVYKRYDLNGPATVKTLYRLQPDLILLLGTGIIRRPVLEIPRHGTIHCHQGYLPTFRGVNTIEWSILSGHDIYLSTHFVDPGVDTGRILLQKKIDLLEGDDITRIRRRCQNLAVPLILETIDGVRNDTLHPQVQSFAEGKQYFEMHPFFVDRVHQIIHRRTAEAHG